MNSKILLVLLLTILLTTAATVLNATSVRVLLAGELLINVILNSGSRTDINDFKLRLANAISLQDAQRLETAAVTFISSTQTMFQYIITAGSPAATTIQGNLETLNQAQKTSLSIERIEQQTTTPPPQVSSDDSNTLRTVLIIAGGAAGGALVSLIIAAIFCKPRATEAEEKRMREKQEETKAKAQAEMQVQQLVRSAAFQRLQERVIELEKDESVRKAIGEVEEQQKKNKNIAKNVARQLLDEPFIEAQDRQIDRETKESDARQSKMSESERRKQRAIDIVENAPWWHNAAIQAEITADLAIPRYSGLISKDDEEEDMSQLDAESKYKRRAVAAKKKSQIAKIPDHLIDYSAVKIISEGHHWLSYQQLPKMNPKIESVVMLAKSNLHGVGVFARRFIDRGTLLFPWANPSQVNSAKHIYTANEMRFHFGMNWDGRLHFVARDGYNKKFCVAEDPKERGWGCCINSCRGTGGGLVANCECVFPEERSAGVIPWVRVTQTIAPLGELLLDYPFPELILKQRGLNPDEFEEPPVPSFSTYGASLTLPLMNTSLIVAPRPKQQMDYHHVAPPPPPEESAKSQSLAPPPRPPLSVSALNSHSSSRANNFFDGDDHDDEVPGDGFRLDIEPLTKEKTIEGGGDADGTVQSPKYDL